MTRGCGPALFDRLHALVCVLDAKKSALVLGIPLSSHLISHHLHARRKVTAQRVSVSCLIALVTANHLLINRPVIVVGDCASTVSCSKASSRIFVEPPRKAFSFAVNHTLLHSACYLSYYQFAFGRGKLFICPCGLGGNKLLNMPIHPFVHPFYVSPVHP